MKKTKTVHSMYHTPDIHDRNERLSNKEKSALKESNQTKAGRVKSFIKLF